MLVATPTDRDERCIVFARQNTRTVIAMVDLRSPATAADAHPSRNVQNPLSLGLPYLPRR
jgi:hypothetical protein